MQKPKATPTFDFDIENLPIDVFELADSGLVVESLTAGHGITEGGASAAIRACSCGGCNSCSTGPMPPI